MLSEYQFNRSTVIFIISETSQILKKSFTTFVEMNSKKYRRDELTIKA